ncbi:MAG: hypothetical protein M3P18_19550 [Actinomycetota bacterium]|nr:hypothetical protein [Actinomycetota bacterium]
MIVKGASGRQALLEHLPSAVMLAALDGVLGHVGQNPHSQLKTEARAAGVL